MTREELKKDVKTPYSLARISKQPSDMLLIFDKEIREINKRSGGFFDSDAGRYMRERVVGELYFIR